MARWIRICLPVQGTWVQSLVQEGFTGRAVNPVDHNFWICSRARVLQLPRLRSAAPEVHIARAGPPQWEAAAGGKPARSSEQRPLFVATSKSPCKATKTQWSQKWINKTRLLFWILVGFFFFYLLSKLLSNELGYNLKIFLGLLGQGHESMVVIYLLE